VNTKRRKKPKLRLRKRVVFGALGILALAVLLWELAGRAGGSGGVFVEVYSVAVAGGSFEKIVTDSGMFVLDGTLGMSFYHGDGSESFWHFHGQRAGSLFGSICGGFAAVVDSLAVNVYNTAGLMYSVQMESRIIRFALGSGGHAVMVLYGGEIALLRPFGVVHTIGRNDDAFAVPTALALAPDGRVAAVAHTDVGGAHLNSTITIISISEDYSGSIAAVNLSNPNQIIGQLHFVEDVLLAVSSSRIFGLNPRTGEELWEIPLDNQAELFAVNNGRIAAVYGAYVLNREGHPEGAVHVYNTNGELIFYTMAENATNISLSRDHILIQTPNNAVIYSLLTGEATVSLHITGTAHFMGSQNRIAISHPANILILER